MPRDSFRRMMSLIITLVSPAACTASPQVILAASPVEVHRSTSPFTYADGAEARRQADQQCGGRVQTSIYDRFEGSTGAWVFPGGCA